MASPSIASYFNVRKRAATDDILNARNKVSRLDGGTSDSIGRAQSLVERAILTKNKLVDADTFGSTTTTTTTKIAETVQSAREKRTVRRGTKRTATTQSSVAAAAATTSTATANKEALKQPKIVKFTLGGSLSPRKKSTSSPSKAAFQSVQRNATPTKQPKIGDNTDAAGSSSGKSTSDAIKASILSKNVTNAKKELTFDEIKDKIGRSSRLDDLKAILNKRQQLEERYQACINKRMAKQKANNSPAKLDGQSLKAFDTIELEVLSSPQKGLRTPTKTPIKTPIKEPGSAEKFTTTAHNDLMSPKRAATPRRLFSPTKSSASVPAYQRFQNLASDTVSTTLQLPYKYRSLLETFRCVDSICAMFYNRKETITFKKLKPAVQRMMRKNLTEKHLAQIKYLDPDAYHFEQRKMLNPGSHTKYDYYQLVITPNVQPLPSTTVAAAAADAIDEIGIQKLDDDNLVRNADSKTMNPQIMIARLQRFQQILLDRVKHEHDQFLRNSNPPIIIPKEKIRRWHQDFELEACPEILPGELPQPPNIEKFSSAKDILSTARNLFNCATPTERIMERYEASTQNAANKLNATATSTSVASNIGSSKATANDRPSTPLSSSLASAPTAAPPSKPAEDPVAKVLKGVPKALLEKIRAKQAAKQLDAMTRRPSQDAEASKYARLPELARYIRNIFVTENKGVLELDKVMSKLENSFRERMSRENLRELLELMSREAPRNWLTFHFIRKTDFIKINRHENLAEIINELERKAQEKAE